MWRPAPRASRTRRSRPSDPVLRRTQQPPFQDREVRGTVAAGVPEQEVPRGVGHPAPLRVPGGELLAREEPHGPFQAGPVRLPHRPGEFLRRPPGQQPEGARSARSHAASRGSSRTAPSQPNTTAGGTPCAGPGTVPWARSAAYARSPAGAAAAHRSRCRAGSPAGSSGSNRCRSGPVGAADLMRSPPASYSETPPPPWHMQAKPSCASPCGHRASTCTISARSRISYASGWCGCCGRSAAVREAVTAMRTVRDVGFTV